MDTKLEYVLAELNRREGQLETVADGANVSRRTIGYLLHSDRDIRASTLNKLYQYLKENQRKKILVKDSE
jgi:hypothetical protein